MVVVLGSQGNNGDEGAATEKSSLLMSLSGLLLGLLLQRRRWLKQWIVTIARNPPNDANHSNVCCLGGIDSPMAVLGIVAALVLNQRF